MAEFFSAVCLRGWILHKMDRSEEAKADWFRVVSFIDSTVEDKLSASCGMAINYASKEETQDVAINLVKSIKDMLEEYEVSDLSLAVYLNSLGIALSKANCLEEAEEILRQAMELNESMEMDFKKAEHQRGKNGYNLVSLILIPSGRIEEAVVELKKNVLPRYKSLGAETDLAAACHRISEIYSIQGNYEKARDAEIISAKLWYKHKKDSPGRFEKSKENLGKILAQMDLDWNEELQKILEKNEML